MRMKDKKLRIAICMRGLADGKSKGTRVCAFTGWDSIVKYVIQDHQADVFCHSWSVDVKDQILSTYLPKKHLIEEQIVFQRGYELGMDSLEAHARKKHEGIWLPHVHKSQLYSISESIDLKNQYEKEMGFEYDVVFVLRYDMYFVQKFDYSMISPGGIVHPSLPRRFKPRKPKQFPYLRRKLWDLYWAADSSTINTLAKAYHTLEEARWRSTSMHITWDKFFELIKFEPNDIRSDSDICRLTRNHIRVKKEREKAKAKATAKATAAKKKRAAKKARKEKESLRKVKVKKAKKAKKAKFKPARTRMLAKPKRASLAEAANMSLREWQKATLKERAAKKAEVKAAAAKEGMTLDEWLYAKKWDKKNGK